MWTLVARASKGQQGTAFDRCESRDVGHVVSQTRADPRRGFPRYEPTALDERRMRRGPKLASVRSIHAKTGTHQQRAAAFFGRTRLARDVHFDLCDGP
jgi:hypothetical protein